MDKLPGIKINRIHPVKYCKAVISNFLKLFNRVKNKILKIIKNKIFWGTSLLILIGGVVGFSAGIIGTLYFPSQIETIFQYFKVSEVEAPVVESSKEPTSYISSISYEQAIIDAAKNVSPSVVSIVISKNLPVYEQQFIDPFGGAFPGFNFQIPQQVQNGTKYQEVGAGSGFIVSKEGLVLTNKHVVSDNKADYTVFMNDGRKYSAKVLALDPVQDLAVIKIEPQEGETFQAVVLGDSDGIQIGQTAIAIGNALGQFKNTVSVGVVSGLGRTVSASNRTGSFSETLQDIIQTDAAINEGNSGGPLLNLGGEVIGINTAMAQGAQGIGFAIPINMAKSAIDQVAEKFRLQSNRGSSTESGQIKIVYPFLGVRYVAVDSQIKEKYNLLVDYGVLVLKGDKGEVAVIKGSAAEKSGIKEKDVILELNGQKITKDKSLAKMITKFMPGDTVSLKILRSDQEINTEAVLGERPQ